MPARLNLHDPQLIPVQAFFNAIGDASFVKMVDCLTSGIGFSVNDVDCTFPGDLDPGEELFDGVRFSLFEERVVITRDELQHYLQITCADFIFNHPEAKPILDEFLCRRLQ
jgi:hypothetical protein